MIKPKTFKNLKELEFHFLEEIKLEDESGLYLNPNHNSFHIY